MKHEVYVSTDVETDGPIPGPHSMLSIGSVAFSHDGKELGSFSRNLEMLEGASGDPDTMDWWSSNQQAWEQHRQDLAAPAEAMLQYAQWCKSFDGPPVFVAYPAGFDFTFVYWYLIRFVGSSPFSFSAIDVKTFAMAILGKPYRQCTKRNMPKSWFDKTAQHSHVAVEDAREQGLLFMEMLRESHKIFKKA